MDSSLTSTGLGNTAPTFAGYSVSTAYQTAAAISLGKLLAKASDADGEWRLEIGKFDIGELDSLAQLATPLTCARSALFRAECECPPMSQCQISHVPYLGIPGRQYQIQRSPDMAEGSWQTIAIITAAANGAVTFTDESPPQPNGFYRLRR